MSDEKKEVALGAAVAPSEVVGAALLAGPLAAVWMLAQNEKVLGSPSRAKAILWLGIGATLVSIIVVFSQAAPLPPYVLPPLYAGVLGSIANHLHREKYERHLAAGGKKHSFWWTLGVCVVGVVATLVMAGVVGMTMAATTP